MGDFFAKFSDFNAPEITIAGEGFAGQYAPILAKKLLDNPIKNCKVNGLLLGNALLEQNISEKF